MVMQIVQTVLNSILFNYQLLVFYYTHIESYPHRRLNEIPTFAKSRTQKDCCENSSQTALAKTTLVAKNRPPDFYLLLCIRGVIQVRCAEAPCTLSEY